MLVSKKEFMYILKQLESSTRGGGGLSPHRVDYVFCKKFSHRAPHAHYASMYCAPTPVVHGAHQRGACPLWGAPPWGLKTWVMEVVVLRVVMKGGFIALVQRTMEVVLVSSITLAFSWAHKWADSLRNPSILKIPNKGHKIRSGHSTPSFLGGPQVGAIAT